MTRLRYWRHFGTYSIRRDATRDVYTAENRVVEAFGKRPDYDPAVTHEHGQWAEAVNCDAELEERAADLEAKRREHAELSRPLLLRLTLAALFVAELISCVLIFAAQGVEPPERIIFGAALAVGIFLVTFYLVEYGTTSEPGGEPGAVRRPRLFIGLLAVLAVVVVCLVVLRTDTAEDGADDPLLVRFALGVVYAVGAVGPAFGGEMVLRRLRPARRVARELRQLEKALAAVVGGKARATRSIRRVSRNTEGWDHWAARGRARYEKVWKAERARHAPVDDPTHPFRTRT